MFLYHNRTHIFIKDHTLIIALRQCWTVSSCQTPPYISKMSIIFDQTKPYHVNLHTLVPRLSTSPVSFCHLKSSTCHFLHGDTQSLLSLRLTCPYHLIRPELRWYGHIEKYIYVNNMFFPQFATV